MFPSLACLKRVYIHKRILIYLDEYKTELCFKLFYFNIKLIVWFGRKMIGSMKNLKIS